MAIDWENCTEDEVQAEIQKDISKWKGRLNRKGPFYLFEAINGIYTVIWQDAEKTKIGTLYDGMFIRYGINTIAVMRGERERDLWNGSAVSDEQFASPL
jgi:hypothetical protein